MNNKQSMKLYTEEQLKKAIELAQECEHECGGVYFDYTEKEIIDELTPIELPSDEEIDAHVEDDFLNASEVHKYSEEAQLLMKSMCKAGALWMRDLIQGGNK